MKLLLDTHVWLWISGDPVKLTPKASAALADPGNELWLSPISVWELAILHKKKKVTLEPGLATWVRRALRTMPLKEAVVTNEVALESERVRLPHRDPADRFLAATARVYGLTLITADQKLLDARSIPTFSVR
jgi:PIN domain nuclease of toxin-antitoxin system